MRAWSEHIGKPLTSVPAPPGSSHASWAEHFRTQAEEGFAALGIRYRSISQTEQYTSGAYTEQILAAMRMRREIDAILAQYRTLPGTATPTRWMPRRRPRSTPARVRRPRTTARAVPSTTRTSRTARSAAPTSRRSRRTTTTRTEMTYTCQCGHSETVLLRDFRSGKLVWKVDWPMRWAYEKVVFEPSGVDHQSPGSSFAVGLELAPLFGWERPYGPMYSFVGAGGAAKMSSSRGGAPDATDALRVMEAPVLRWQYARRRMNQSFDVAFGTELQRLYDEWDALGRKVGDGSAGAAEVAAHARAVATADGAAADDAASGAVPNARIARRPLDRRCRAAAPAGAGGRPDGEESRRAAAPTGSGGDLGGHADACRGTDDGSQRPRMPRRSPRWTPSSEPQSPCCSTAAAGCRRSTTRGPSTASPTRCTAW